MTSLGNLYTPLVGWLERTRRRKKKPNAEYKAPETDE
jgi:hypothetical protein